MFCINKPYYCRDFFLTDWRHKCLKNTMDLLLFYGEYFYGFSESDLRKRRKKNIHFNISNKHICIYGSRTFWSFMKFYFVHIFFFLIGMHPMQGWTATTRHGVTIKKSTKKITGYRKSVYKERTVKVIWVRYMEALCVSLKLLLKKWRLLNF